LTKKRDDDYPRSPFSRSTLLPRERSHASRISAPSGRDRFLAAFSTPIGPEESVPTRIGAAGAEMGEEREWDAAGTTGREAGWQACARARGGGEGRRAVGGRDRKTRVDCPCALGWLLERWHSDAYLRLPGVPFAPSFAAFLYHSRKRDLVSFRGKKFIGDSSPIFHVFFRYINLYILYSPLDHTKSTSSKLRKVSVLKVNFYFQLCCILLYIIHITKIIIYF